MSQGRLVGMRVGQPACSTGLRNPHCLCATQLSLLPCCHAPACTCRNPCCDPLDATPDWVPSDPTPPPPPHTHTFATACAGSGRWRFKVPVLVSDLDLECKMWLKVRRGAKEGGPGGGDMGWY
jgi:hypothetical protein